MSLFTIIFIITLLVEIIILLLILRRSNADECSKTLKRRLSDYNQIAENLEYLDRYLQKQSD